MQTFEELLAAGNTPEQALALINAAKAASANGTKVRVRKYRYNLTYLQDMPDVPVGPFKLLGVSDKDTGVWMRIQFSNGKVTVVDSGMLAAMHNSGTPIFVEASVTEDSEATLLPNLQLGVRKHELVVQ